MLNKIPLIILLLVLVTATSYARDIVVMAIFGEMVIIKVDGKQHKLKTGDKTPGGIKLVSVDSDSVVLEINNKRSTYRLGGHASFGSGKNDRGSQVTIYAENGMYRAQGSINKQLVYFMVDTGATWVAMGEKTARQLGINYKLGMQGHARTANGVARFYQVNLEEVRVGDVRLTNVLGAVLLGRGMGNQVLLGMSFLKRCKIQREGGAMVLTKIH